MLIMHHNMLYYDTSHMTHVMLCNVMYWNLIYDICYMMYDNVMYHNVTCKTWRSSSRSPRPVYSPYRLPDVPGGVKSWQRKTTF